MKTIILFFIFLSVSVFSQSWYQTQIDSGLALTDAISLTGSERLVGLSVPGGFEADTITFQVYDRKSAEYKEIKYNDTIISVAVDTLYILYLDQAKFRQVDQFKMRANTSAAPDSTSDIRYINYITEPK